LFFSELREFGLLDLDPLQGFALNPRPNARRPPK